MATEQHIEVMASLARLEEQGKGMRRDLVALKASTDGHLANHYSRLASLERSRSTAKGWLKGVSAVGILAAIVSFFQVGG